MRIPGWRVAARALARALLAGALGGCASVVRNELTVFHEWPADGGDRSYRFVRSAAQRDSLAQSSYEQALRTELATVGFRESAQPRFEIGFDYGVERKPRLVVEAAPVFRPYVYLGAGGHRGAAFFGGSVAWWPWYGTYEREQLIYEHRLTLQIADLRANPVRRVYEATVTTDAFASDPLGVLPYLARAFLAEFPGRSGSTRRIDVPVPPPVQPGR